MYGPNKKQVYKYIWHLMIDITTGYVTDGFFKAKSSFIKLACEQLQKWNDTGNKVKIIQQDNDGENKLFKQRASSSN